MSSVSFARSSNNVTGRVSFPSKMCLSWQVLFFNSCLCLQVIIEVFISGHCWAQCFQLVLREDELTSKEIINVSICLKSRLLIHTDITVKISYNRHIKFIFSRNTGADISHCFVQQFWTGISDDGCGKDPGRVNQTTFLYVILPLHVMWACGTNLAFLLFIVSWFHP